MFLLLALMPKTNNFTSCTHRCTNTPNAISKRRMPNLFEPLSLEMVVPFFCALSTYTIACARTLYAVVFVFVCVYISDFVHTLFIMPLTASKCILSLGFTENLVLYLLLSLLISRHQQSNPVQANWAMKTVFYMNAIVNSEFLQFCIRLQNATKIDSPLYLCRDFPLQNSFPNEERETGTNEMRIGIREKIGEKN